MKKLGFLALVMVMALGVGCAQKIWKHHSHSDFNQFNRDKAECEMEALKYGQTSMFGNDYMTNAFMTGQREAQIFNGCMQLRGYYLDDK